MKKLDWYIQTALFVAAITLLIATLLNEGFFYLSAFAQLLLAAWQYISALYSVVSSNVGRKKLCIQLAFGYLALLILSMYSNISWPGSLIMIYLFVVPWPLAIWYYILTYKSIFSSHRKRGNFLPHINF